MRCRQKKDAKFGRPLFHKKLYKKIVEFSTLFVTRQKKCPTFLELCNLKYRSQDTYFKRAKKENITIEDYLANMNYYGME